MRGLVGAVVHRLIRCFVAGVLAILPVVVTVAVVAWVAGFLRSILGPGTWPGEGLRRLGLPFAEGWGAYLAGAALVLAAVFLLGVFVEAGARNLVERLIDGLLHHIPLVGNIYGTSKQLLGLLGRRDQASIQGMRAVFCHFGQEHGGAVLALLVSSQRFHIDGRDYLMVIVPTSPVPIGGGLLFVPAELVRPVDVSVEALMSIYVSMGVTAPQFLRLAGPEA